MPRLRFALALPLLFSCAPPDPASSDSTTTADETTDPSADEESTAVAPSCGDGNVDDGEECDDGDDNAENAACLPDCVENVCGDGFVNEGVEECDDANDDNGDGCTTMCIVLESCGDGIIQAPEECDDGPDNADDAACRTDCLPAFCGDGFVQTGVEECDDMNEENNDACTELCAPPECGDGFVQNVLGELCDDGDQMDGDECRNDCQGSGIWTDTHDGPSSSNDIAYGVATDSDGNVIVVGSVFEGAEGDNVWVRKYDPDGNEIWTQTHHGVTADIGYAVAVASDDSAFVAGSVFTASDDRDIWVRRYLANGNADWTQTANGAADDRDEALGVAVAPDGDVAVVGFLSTTGSGRQIWVRNYTAAGGTDWTQTAGGGSDDEAHGVAVDGEGNVLVAGFSGTGGNRDIWVRKYTPAGNEDWTQTHAGPASGNDEGHAIAADGSDNVIVAGYENVAGEAQNVFVRKYSPAGAEEWTFTYNAAQNGSDVARGVATDGDDNIVVAGSSFRGAHSDNIWVRKLDSAGDTIWTTTYNSDGSGSDVANATTTDDEDNIAVAGFETRSDLGQSRNAWVRRILQ